MNGTNSETRVTQLDLIDVDYETAKVDGGVPPQNPNQRESKPETFHQRFKFRQKVAPKRPRGQSLPSAPLRFIFEEFLNHGFSDNTHKDDTDFHSKTQKEEAFREQDCIVGAASGDDARIISSHTSRLNMKKKSNDIPFEQAASVVLTSFATELRCSVCFDLMRDPAILPCTHGFCNSCIARSLAHKKYCPLCKTEVHARSVMKSHPLKSLVEAMEGLGTVLGIDDVTDEQEITDVLGMMPLSKKKTAHDKHTCTPSGLGLTVHHADNSKEEKEEKAQEEELAELTSHMSRKSSFLSQVNTNARGSSFSHSLRLNVEASETNSLPTNEKAVVVNSDNKRNEDDCANDLSRGQNNPRGEDAPSYYARKLYKITATSFENAVQTRRLESQQAKLVDGCPTSTTTQHRRGGEEGNCKALHVSSPVLPSGTHSSETVTLYSLPPLLREVIVNKQQVSEANGGEVIFNRLIVKSAGLRDEDNAMMVGSFEYGSGIGDVYSRLTLKGGWLDAPCVEFLHPNYSQNNHRPYHDHDQDAVSASASSVVAASAEITTPHVHCALCGLATDDRAGIRKFLRFILSQDVSCDRAALLSLDARQLSSLFGNLIPVNFSLPCMARRDTKYSCREVRQNNPSDVTSTDIPVTAYAHELCLLWSSPVKLLKTVGSAAARQGGDNHMFLTPYAIVSSTHNERHSNNDNGRTTTTTTNNNNNTGTCQDRKIDDTEGIIAMNSVAALRDGWSRACAFCGRLGATVLGGRGGTADGTTVSLFGSANDEPRAYHAPCALLTGDMVCTI